MVGTAVVAGVGAEGEQVGGVENVVDAPHRQAKAYETGVGKAHTPSSHAMRVAQTAGHGGVEGLLVGDVEVTDDYEGALYRGYTLHQVA